MPSVDTARAILSTLDALGVTHVLYCPGSRSAPFAYALESGAFGGHARAVLDERGAGFAAVGLARTGPPSSSPPEPPSPNWRPPSWRPPTPACPSSS